MRLILCWTFVAIITLLAIACSNPPSIEPTPTPVSLVCPSMPPIYHPGRLMIRGECEHYVGVVIAVIYERDGDRHLWIKPDEGYDRLLNSMNVYHNEHALVAEIVPLCAKEPENEIIAAQCPPSKVTVPQVGDHVEISGRWVFDKNHGWNEIHPVAFLKVLS